MQHLTRSRTNRVFGGVLGGIGQAYGIDPTVLRLIYLVLTLVTGVLPAVVLYLIAWIVMPEGSVVPTVGA